MSLDIVIDQRAYQDIVISNDPFAAFYPDPVARPARGHVYTVVTGLNASVQHIYLGVFTKGQRVVYPFNPATDQNVTFAVIAEAADGTREFSSVRDAVKVTALMQRQSPSDSGVLTQSGYSDPTTIQLSVTGFSPYAVAREIQEATNSGFTTGLSSQVYDGSSAQDSVYFATRPSSPGQSAETKYLRVRHSTTGVDGPWSNWSTGLEITFAEEPI